MASATSLQAATLAVQSDGAGDVAAAVAHYDTAVRGLQDDIRVLGNGPEVEAMRAKANEYAARAQILRAQIQLGPGAPAPAAVGGAVGGGGTVAVAEGGAPKPAWETYAGAAGAGALGGAMVVGGILGAPILGALAGAGGLAYAATRSDGYGGAARTVGGATATGVGKARNVNREYKLTEKAVAAGKSTVQTVRAMDTKYHITDKIGGVFTAAGAKAKKLDAKYDLGGKASALGGAAAGAMSSGLDGVTQAGDAAQQRMAASDGAAAGPTATSGTGASGPQAI
jgi:hypothetical protein